MVKVLLILMVIFVLMEDSTSIRKTEEEKREEEEVARAVNATLAEEERKKKEEDEKKEKATEKKNEGKKKMTDRETGSGSKDEDEASPSGNITCPDVMPCLPCKDCEICKDCPPEVKCGPCPTVKPCRPCLPVDCHPCSVVNSTRDHQDCPSAPACPETEGMSVPVALAVGASAGVLLTGVATVIGLILRYVNPIASGFFFVATVVLIWYLSSHYPETARELGARAATLLREAATTLGHRLVEALQRHTEQVGVPLLSLISSSFLV
jgi:uncharacterized membrane protein YphA (DoxX/SURF4 family)